MIVRTTFERSSSFLMFFSKELALCTELKTEFGIVGWNCEDEDEDELCLSELLKLE